MEAAYWLHRSIGQSGKSVLEIGPDSIYIVEAFKQAAAGVKQVEIATKLKKAGFYQATPKFVGRILTNPIYCGFMRVLWFPDLIEASHPPIVSQDLFWRVQQIIKGGKSKRRHKIEHPEFPLRGFVFCNKCGIRLTSGYCRGKRNSYPYYFCRTPECSVTLRRDDLHEAFYQLLQSIEPKPEIYALFEEIVRDHWQTKRTDLISDKKRINRLLFEAEQNKRKLDDLMIRGVMDEETYRERSSELRAEIATRKVELSESKIDRRIWKVASRIAGILSAMLENSGAIPPQI
ncbi:recombinase family protein [bacterium]|nr:recombinase family protein [bacterium]